MMFLTSEEVIDLTGKKRPSAQVRALRGMGIEHRVRADGKVIVARAHIEKILDCNVENKVKKRIEPKWELMK